MCVAKPLMGPYMKDGPQGMADVLRQMTGELRGIMARTGSGDVKHIDPSVIHPVCF